MRIERHYTTDGRSPYDSIEFRTATSEIRNPDGSVVFRLDNIQVPASWSQVATDIIAQKYFRKAGVPARLRRVEENTVPSWLWRSEADSAALGDLLKRSASPPRSIAARSLTVWPAPGRTGAGRAATFLAKPTPTPSSTSCASCSP